MLDVRTLIAQLDEIASNLIVALNTDEPEDDDMIQTLEDLQSKITDYQQGQGWI